MARLGNAKGVTRVEVVVAVLVSVFFLSLLPPVLRHGKSDAARDTCRANLALIGKAMLLYANDYEDALPRVGGRNSAWGVIANWMANNRITAFGLNAQGANGSASISSCFYLLVKYAEVMPKYFVCPGDAGTTEFTLSDNARLPRGFELIDAWDFGMATDAYKHCSYAYHMPFGMYALTTACDPAMAVAALDSPLPEHKNVIWCSTFQMAWDKLKQDVIGEPIHVVGAEELAGWLNRAQYPVGDIEARSYYAAAGSVKNGIIEGIQKEMARRFPSEPAPTFDARYKTLPDVILAYAYLNVDVGFSYPYYTYLGKFDFQDSGGSRTGVTAFCGQTSAFSEDQPRVRDQVEVLYYDYGSSPEAGQFAVDLSKKTQPYRVILARVPRCDTFGEAAKALQGKIAEFKKDSDYEALRKLKSGDTLIVPDVLYKLTHHFDELLGKHLDNPRWANYLIFEALQKIDFTLSRTGVVLKSHAWTSATASRSARQLAQPRRLHFDRPFLICVQKREPDATPFFLMWVDNAELMRQYENGAGR